MKLFQVCFDQCDVFGFWNLIYKHANIYEIVYLAVYFHTVALVIIELLYILIGKLMLQIVLDPILSTTLLRNYLGHSVPIKLISHDEPLQETCFSVSGNAPKLTNGKVEL